VFENMTTADRIAAAKTKTARVIDHLLYLLELHENNAIILYSPTLSSQIPTSYAANAFNVFQRALHQFEIVRLCALWDRAEEDKENIPTIVELINDPKVIDALAEETRSHWTDAGGTILNDPSDDPQLFAAAEDAFRRSNEQFGQKQAMKARSDLTEAICVVRYILKSESLTAIMNIRDKHLAHSLSRTRREKTGPITRMQYGDEREMLSASLKIAENLYCWVNGTSFSFANSREIDRKNAEALWHHCTFGIDI
jgi:AbiU2